jgi:hypothetical protein
VIKSLWDVIMKRIRAHVDFEIYMGSYIIYGFQLLFKPLNNNYLGAQKGATAAC